MANELSATARDHRRRQFFNPRKAIDELNLPQSDLDATFAEAVNAFRTLTE